MGWLTAILLMLQVSVDDLRRTTIKKRLPTFASALKCLTGVNVGGKMFNFFYSSFRFTICHSRQIFQVLLM